MTYLVSASIAIAFCVGVYVGYRIAICLAADSFKQGKWSRKEMEGLLRVWRGPDGEQWDDKIRIFRMDRKNKGS
jgi:hypothetical protein